MDGGDDGMFRELLDRFQSLEASHVNLRQQFDVLLQEKPRDFTSKEEEVIPDSGDVKSFPDWGFVPGTYFSGSPYRNVLEYMGHAVHVSRTGSWEINYWNRAAEKLYGYKDYEVVGERVVELLFNEEHHISALALMDRLSSGKSWSGQLPLRKRYGQRFMALVTMSPLYEDGKLVGVVTVSSDASVFNNTNSGNMRAQLQDHAIEQATVRRINPKKSQWHPPSRIAALPQLPSSISNLASRVLSRKRGDVTCDVDRSRESEEAEVESQDGSADRPPRAPIAKPVSSLFKGRSETEAMSSEKEESTSEFARSSRIAAKFFSKLQRGAVANLEKAMGDTVQQKSSAESSIKKETAYEHHFPRDKIEGTSPDITNHDADNHIKDVLIGTCGAIERKQHVHKLADQLPRPSSESNGVSPKIKYEDTEDASSKQSDSHKSPSSGESSDASPSSKGESSRMLVGSEIRWEDLQLREEVGQGSFAIVYRGLWNGSDVAVKVYFGNQYTEQTLLDYKKEIDIMRRLRHPNVLLFMGAVCTEEKLAMVTEYLTRGSLFKTLHKSNQSLDIRRRLRMAIDVSRGMNYLHHRNPPIVHRDLKSSNLLVDKSWNVKVGDFGLSKLKCATFLTARSGRGTVKNLPCPSLFNSWIMTCFFSLTAFLLSLFVPMTDFCTPGLLQPQWMAPEVLRNEPSTEK